MNSKKTIILLVLMALIACFLLTGCVGLIKPSIGEISAAVEEAEAEQAAESGDASGEAGDASGEASGEAGDASGEASDEASGEASDEASGDASGEVTLEGDVLYRFEYTDKVSGSLGALSDLIIEVKVYDTPDTDEDQYLITVDLGGSVSTQTGIWTMENGTLLLRINDFQSYESRIIDGVPTILGIEYGSMMNRGMAEVPMVEGDVSDFAAEEDQVPAAIAGAPASGEASAETSASGEAS